LSDTRYPSEADQQRTDTARAGVAVDGETLGVALTASAIFGNGVRAMTRSAAVAARTASPFTSGARSMAPLAR
jgi:hypothetical protein